MRKSDLGNVLLSGLVQSLPKLANFSSSLFVVYAGYQDYFFSLYDGTLSIKKTKKIVPDVVKAIEDLIVVSSSAMHVPHHSLQSFNSLVQCFIRQQFVSSTEETSAPHRSDVP